MVELLLFVLAVAGSYIGAIAMVFFSWKVMIFFSCRIEESKRNSQVQAFEEKSKIGARFYSLAWMISAFLFLPATLIIWVSTIGIIGLFLINIYGKTGYFMSQTILAPCVIFLFWKANEFFSHKIEESNISSQEKDSAEKARTQSWKKRFYQLAWLMSCAWLILSLLSFVCLIGMLLVSISGNEIIEFSFILYITLLTWRAMKFFSYRINESNRSLQKQDSIKKPQARLWEKRLYLLAWITSGFLSLFGILKIIARICFFIMMTYGRTGYFVALYSINFCLIFLLWKATMFFLQKVRILKGQVSSEKFRTKSLQTGLFRFACVASGLCLVILSLGLVFFFLKETKIYIPSKSSFLRNAA